VNSCWLLYRRRCDQLAVVAKERLDLLSPPTLNDQIAPALSRRRGRPSVASRLDTVVTDDIASAPKLQTSVDAAAIRLDGVGHLPAFVDDRQRCKVCSKEITQMTC